MLKNIKVSEIVPSKTNPRGTGFEKAEEFGELVASITEKGVLVPILVRPIENGKFEVVAGHRRFAAATVAGLTEIPAKIEEMTDLEAREAQIVENMQRKDVHPLDEAEAFKFLADKRGADVVEIAKRVGKSEKYVRERLGLTNLSYAAKKMLRNDEMNLTTAIVISKCEVEKIQKEALSRVKNGWGAESIKKMIGEQMYIHYGSKPWAKDAKLAEILGDTKKASLFNADMESVDDPALHAKQMQAYIELEMRKQTEKGNKIVKISTSYGTPEMKGVLAKDQYRILETAKDRKTASEDILGIVVEGWNDEGKVYHITTAAEDLKGSTSTAHKLTPEDRAARKAEREKEEAKKQKKDEKILEAIGKVKMPMSEKHLDILFDVCFRRFGFSYMQPVAARHGIKAIKVTKNGYTHRDLETPLRAHFEEKGKNGKLQFIFEVGMEAVGGSGDGVDSFIKKL